jgi:hypothetical protein
VNAFKAHLISYDRSERFATLLLDAGAPLDGLSNDELIKLVRSVAVFNRLLARDVNVTTMRDDSGSTLCHHVVRTVGNEDDLWFFVNVCGNDAVHAVDNHGRTPLHVASIFDNYSAMRVLLESGAEIDRQDNEGVTALINTTRSRSLRSCLELLLAFGADVSLADGWGRTASHRAAFFQAPATVCALVAAGGNLEQPDNKGSTPRMIAIRERVALPTSNEINAARRRIAKARLDLVRQRAFQICVGLQSGPTRCSCNCAIHLDAFVVARSCSMILFHQWWAIATKVKHKTFTTYSSNYQLAKCAEFETKKNAKKNAHVGVRTQDLL